MKLAQSRLTKRGQVSVPAEVRRRMGLLPGAILQWAVQDDESVVVRRGGSHNSEDVHRRLFPVVPQPRRLEALKAGIRRHIRLDHGQKS